MANDALEATHAARMASFEEEEIARHPEGDPRGGQFAPKSVGPATSTLPAPLTRLKEIISEIFNPEELKNLAKEMDPRGAFKELFTEPFAALNEPSKGPPPSLAKLGFILKEIFTNPFEDSPPYPEHLYAKSRKDEMRTRRAKDNYYESKEDLPAEVKESLPSEAQEIFIEAFNQACYEDDMDEEQAHKVAWAAVKNAGYEKKGEGWSKMKDHAYRFTEAMVLDSNSTKQTKEGYLLAMPRVARTGIQLYRGIEVGEPNKQVVRLYRPDSEVFSRRSVSGYARKPVTLEHPPELVTADNWAKYAVGSLDGEIVRDGEFIRVPLMVMDSDAVRAINDGKKELSAGYEMIIDWTPGRTALGEDYDGIQRQIVINHVAITDSARGGTRLRIGDAYLGDIPRLATKRGTNMPTESTTILVGDKRVTVEVEGAPIILRALKDANDAISDSSSKNKDLEEELAKEKAKNKKTEDALKTVQSELAATISAKDAVIATKDAEVATLRQQMNDSALTPQKLDQIVKERAEIIDKAKKLYGDRVMIEGKTNTEIMRQVVDARVGAGAKGWSDENVRISFDTLTVQAQPQRDALADALSRRSQSPSFTLEGRDDMLGRRRKFLEDGWKTPVSTRQ